VEDAKSLQEAGCYAIVIEGVPEKISEYITNQLSIPTIGIGAGNKTSGQILVWHDIFGLYSDRVPKFSKTYVDLGSQVVAGLSEYKREVEVGTLLRSVLNLVRAGNFPPHNTLTNSDKQFGMSFVHITTSLRVCTLPSRPRHLARTCYHSYPTSRY
jgi:hypothetical protein